MNDSIEGSRAAGRRAPGFPLAGGASARAGERAKEAAGRFGAELLAALERKGRPCPFSATHAERASYPALPATAGEGRAGDLFVRGPATTLPSNEQAGLPGGEREEACVLETSASLFSLRPTLESGLPVQPSPPAGAAAEGARQAARTIGAWLARAAVELIAGRKRASMRLECPSLGSVGLELRLRDGEVAVEFSAPAAATRALLAERGHLETQLSSVGLSLGSLELRGERSRGDRPGMAGHPSSPAAPRRRGSIDPAARPHSSCFEPSGRRFS